MWATDLSGSTALVSGASRGIGRAIALGLAEAGADIVGLARTEEALKELGEEVGSMGRTFLPLVFDLAEVEAVSEAAAAAWEWQDGIDILINVAGTIIRTEPPHVTHEEWDRLFAINLRSPFFLTQSVTARMLENRGGCVVNIASLAGEVVTRASVTYQMSKAAMIQMTRAMAVRCAPAVRVNAVGPGYIRTDINEAWLDDEANRGYVEARTPLGRVGRANDVVGSVVFLASPAAAFITGQHLLVDGGWSAQ